MLKIENEKTKSYRLPYIVIIMYYLMENDLTWSAFVNEVKEKNIKGKDATQKIFEILEENMNELTTILNKDSTIYRARIAENDLFAKHIGILVESIGGKSRTPAFEKKLAKCISNEEESTFSAIALISAILDNAEKMDSYLHALNEAKYKGYDGNNSMLAPSNRVKAGRSNKKHEAMLYATLDSETCIYEAKPVIGQKVSIAQLLCTKDLKIFDLTKTKQTQKKNNLLIDTLMGTINKQFSLPNCGNDKDYIPTQAITSFVKNNLGFDGIMFNSSLKKKGKNVVIFDAENCIPQGSECIAVLNIKINTKNLFEEVLNKAD